MKIPPALWIALALAAGYALVVLLAYLAQDRMLFFPDRTLAATPDAIGLPFEDVEFVAADGTRLHGWWIPASGARRTVLFCHGNAGDVADRLFTLQTLHDMQLSVLIFDYRGYGRSEGRPSESGLHADAAAAWHHLVEERSIPPGEIVVWGRSLGGAVAARLAADVRPAGLIVESSFSRAVDVAAHHYPWLPVGRLMRHRFDAAAAVARTDVPKLFLHAPQDDVIPYALGTRLFDAAAPPKRRVDLRGDHNTSFAASVAIVRDAVGDFLATGDDGLESRE